MNNIKFFNSKDNEEHKAEIERFEQAHAFLTNIVLYNSDDRKPGDYTRRYGYKYSRLHELKGYHFDFSFRRNYI